MTTVAVENDEQLVRNAVEALLAEHDPRSMRGREFLGYQFDAGLAWVHFPVGFGGLGVSPKLQRVVNDAVFAAGAPNPVYRNIIGYGMGAPTVVTHGSDEQKRRYLRPLFTGEEVWCQLFSEPGAGSDVAALSTRAVRDGDEWIVNGQKVWTTLAHVARWGMLVSRTDPEQPKHKGMTYFVVDMHAPGVEVKPLRQITGEAEFNEVFFTDVRIPDAERLGDVGEGWRVALTTLMNERVSIGGGAAPRGGGPIGDALRVWEEKGHNDPVLRDELMRLWIEAEVNRLTNIRAGQNRQKGTPGPEGSTGKLSFAETNKRIYEFVVNLLGAEGLLYGSYEMVRPDTAMESDSLQKAFLRSRANSIEGGTSEIMRNILGERVLGLPGDVRTDKELPWAQVPR
ncbi:MAG TPA: acyl-CoA dehydrogenase family protein [Acidimicrobiales bacterium]|nr:acyl-CoA dehydrogenase family protein [Acidimicrobiales bacterium]